MPPFPNRIASYGSFKSGCRSLECVCRSPISFRRTAFRSPVGRAPVSVAQVTRRVSSIQRGAALVDEADIDFRARTSPEGAITMLFTDIEGSTEMVERLGDEAWVEILRAHNSLVRGIVGRFDGIEVKAQGDGFMLAFQSSRMGLGCAIEIQRALEAYAVENPEHAPRVRVGVHSGFAIHEESDFFGRTVIL